MVPSSTTVLQADRRDLQHRHGRAERQQLLGVCRIGRPGRRGRLRQLERGRWRKSSMLDPVVSTAATRRPTSRRTRGGHAARIRHGAVDLAGDVAPQCVPRAPGGPRCVAAETGVPADGAAGMGRGTGSPPSRGRHAGRRCTVRPRLLLRPAPLPLAAGWRGGGTEAGAPRRAGGARSRAGPYRQRRPGWRGAAAAATSAPARYHKPAATTRMISRSSVHGTANSDAVPLAAAMGTTSRASRRELPASGHVRRHRASREEATLAARWRTRTESPGSTVGRFLSWNLARHSRRGR